MLIYSVVNATSPAVSSRIDLWRFKHKTWSKFHNFVIIWRSSPTSLIHKLFSCNIVFRFYQMVRFKEFNKDKIKKIRRVRAIEYIYTYNILYTIYTILLKTAHRLLGPFLYRRVWIIIAGEGGQNSNVWSLYESWACR